MKKRLIIILMIFIILINIYNLSFADDSLTLTTSETLTTNDTISNVSDPNFTIYSDGAILIDSKTGNILAQKDMDKQLYPASTTKILTAIIAIEKLNLDDVLTASYTAVMSIPSGYSNAGIKEGEQFTVSDLLDMFLIHSANEIGYIFAEHISGSISEFANLMNEKAKELGCKNTHFTNPSGIQDPEHYSTAYDMAQIARYCMKNETFRNIVNKDSCKIAATSLYPEERYFKNTNSLLDSSNRYYYEYAIGVKTGFTSQAKNCLIACSVKDGVELIAVLLGAEATETGLSGRYTDAINLFNYGFENYEIKNFLDANTVIQELQIKNATKETKNLSIVAKDSLSTLLPTNYDVTNLQYSIELKNDILAPIAKDAVLGKITYNIDGITYTSDLIASNDVLKSKVMITVLQVLLAIVILFILAMLISPKNRKKKKNNKKYNNNLKNNNDFNSIYKFKIE